MLVRLFVGVLAVTAIRGAWLGIFPEPAPKVTTYGYDAKYNTHTCVNSSGDTFVTNDAEACREFEVAYPCKYGDNTYSVKDEAACKVKIAERTKEEVKEFDPYAYAEEYKQASDAVIALDGVR